jgi:hypothetical protein
MTPDVFVCQRWVSGSGEPLLLLGANGGSTTRLNVHATPDTADAATTATCDFLVRLLATSEERALCIEGCEHWGDMWEICRHRNNFLGVASSGKGGSRGFGGQGSWKRGAGPHPAKKNSTAFFENRVQSVVAGIGTETISKRAKYIALLKSFFGGKRC